MEDVTKNITNKSRFFSLAAFDALACWLLLVLLHAALGDFTDAAFDIQPAIVALAFWDLQ